MDNLEYIITNNLKIIEEKIMLRNEHLAYSNIKIKGINRIMDVPIENNLIILNVEYTNFSEPILTFKDIINLGKLYKHLFEVNIDFSKQCVIFEGDLIDWDLLKY